MTRGSRNTLDLLWELILRDLKIRYMRSYVGILWSLLTPLAQIIIFSFLFRKVMPLNVPHYTAFVFCGVLAWTWFSSSLVSAAGVIVASPELVRRPGFPVEVLPVQTVASNAIQFLLAFPLLLVLSPLDGGTLGAALLAIPVVLAVQFLLTLSLALPVAAANVRFRDTQHVILLATMAAFYLTPVFYSAEAVPDEYLFLYNLNPMTAILSAYRDILIDNQWPSFGALALIGVLSLAALLFGHRLFRRASLQFAEEL